MAVNVMNSGNSSSASTAASSSAVRALALEIKSLQEDPLEGIRSRLVNEDNLFEWEVALFGPPDTLYQGGYFKAHMKFPPDYPYSPPSVRFITKVCIQTSTRMAICAFQFSIPQLMILIVESFHVKDGTLRKMLEPFYFLWWAYSMSPTPIALPMLMPQ